MRSKSKALWIFLAVVAALAGVSLQFIQSRYFAGVLKDLARRYFPADLGIEGDFTELAVKLVPPGVVFRNAGIRLKENNIAGLPAGTRLDAASVDITFQLFQLLTGMVTVNAVAIHDASVAFSLDERFLEGQAGRLHGLGKSPKAGQAPPKGSFWDSLVRLEFRSVSLIDSRVELSFRGTGAPGPVRLATYARELTVGRSTVDRLPAYDLALDLKDSLVDTPWFKHPVALFQASLEVSSRGVAIRSLGLQDGELSAHMSGAIRGDLANPKSLKSEVSCIARGPIPKWLAPDLLGRFVRPPADLPLSGSIALDGRMTGDLVDLGRTLEAQALVDLENAALGEWRADKCRSRVLWKAPVMTVESLEAQVGSGRVALRGLAVDLARREQEVALHAELQDADLRRLAGPALKDIYPLHMLLTGKIDGTLSTGNEPELDGSVDLKVRGFSFDNQKPAQVKPLKTLLAVDDIGLRGDFSIDSEGISFENVDASLPRSKLRAEGEVGSKSGFNLDIRGGVDTADIGKLGPFPILGSGDLHWTITGKKPNIIFAFDADLKDAEYLKLRLGAVRGRIVYNDGTDTISFESLHATQGRTELLANGDISVGASETVRMTVGIPRGTIQDFSGLFDWFLKQSVPWYPRDLTGQLSGNLLVSGKTDLDQLSIEGDVNLQNVELKRELIREIQAHAGYRRGAYVAERVLLRKKTGLVRGNVVFGEDGALRYDLRSENLSTLDLDLLAAMGVPYRAPISLEAKGTGRPGSLQSSLHVSVGEGVIKNQVVAPSEVSLSTDHGRMRAEGSALGGKAKGSFDGSFEPDAGCRLQLEAKGFDFRPMLIALNPDMAEDSDLGSELTGAAQLKFRAGEISRLSGSVSLYSYLLKRKGFSLALTKPARVEIRDGNYELSDVRFEGEGSRLLAKGRVRDGRIESSLAGDLNLGILELLIGEIPAVHGTAQIEARLTGAADAPDLAAHASASGADIRLSAFEQPFEELKFRLNLDNALLRVPELSAKFAGGKVRGQGTATLYPNKVPDMDFKLELDNPKMKVYPAAYARVSGRLGLKGSDLPYKVKGSLSVAEALVTENFSLSENSRILRSSKFLPPARQGGLGDLQLFDLDLDLAFERGVLVRNDLFDAELRGNFKVINSPRTPRLLGNISVLRGKLFFKDNYFAIQNGDLRFTNPAVIDPELNFTGQTEVKGYKVGLVASGTVSDYKLAFQSQPPLSQNDIVSLLTLGVTSSGLQKLARENREAYSRDEMYGLIFSQSGVNKGLQEKTGFKVRLDQSQALVPDNAFRPKPADTAESVAPKVVLQREITKNLNASFGSTVGVSENIERNANLEYELRGLHVPALNDFSLLGVYEDQNGPQLKQQRTSVGADLKYKLRFKW